MTMSGPAPLPEWPRWMKASTLARYIGYTESAVRPLQARGTLPFSKLGETVLFDRLVVDRLLERRALGNPQERQINRTAPSHPPAHPVKTGTS